MCGRPWAADATPPRRCGEDNRHRCGAATPYSLSPWRRPSRPQCWRRAAISEPSLYVLGSPPVVPRPSIFWLTLRMSAAGAPRGDHRLIWALLLSAGVLFRWRLPCWSRRLPRRLRRGVRAILGRVRCDAMRPKPTVSSAADLTRIGTAGCVQAMCCSVWAWAAWAAWSRSTTTALRLSTRPVRAVCFATSTRTTAGWTRSEGHAARAATA